MQFWTYQIFDNLFHTLLNSILGLCQRKKISLALILLLLEGVVGFYLGYQSQHSLISENINKINKMDLKYPN